VWLTLAHARWLESHSPRRTQVGLASAQVSMYVTAYWEIGRGGDSCLGVKAPGTRTIENTAMARLIVGGERGHCTYLNRSSEGRAESSNR
jgi:hypothetical protein